VAFVVAHRAGNDLALLKEAERLPVALVEADVRLWRGRAEVRHLKTLGPVPILWDRWRLANPLAARLALRELLEASGPRTELLLDLKGRDERLADLVLAELPAGRQVTVCARSPRLLERFRGLAHVRVFQSAGTRRQVRALLRDADRALDGVAVHERLLDSALVAELAQRGLLVLTWPVNSVRRAAELSLLGVHGLISDTPADLVTVPA
jgi:glycerophosphoryl diester phosphodiesterase